MKISSSVFKHNEVIPIKYTCKGPNISPPIEFSDIPNRTNSFALMILDSDATPKPWVHWLVFNIPSHIKSLEEGKIPDGAVNAVCNGGTHGYEGPCPIYFGGTHHYLFKLFALDTILSISPESDKEKVEEAMKGHILAEAELIGLSHGDK